MEFWTEPQMASIDKMLNPRSIAIVGATPRMQYGGRFLAAALKAKDRVRVYAVNPRYDEIMGEKSYPSITDLPEAPDVVAIVVRYDQVLDVLRESHAKGAGSAIVISAGFAERGVDDRRDLQGELGEFARNSGMRISGPNCLGLANVKHDIWATSSSRGADGLSGPIGLVCQSGATAFGPFLVRAVESGIGFSYIISTGNEADLDFTDFARYLLDDPDTRVIAGFIEGFKRADKFLEVAKLAAERGKPIVLIKIGRSELGARAAQSHTAALTGEDARYDAIFAQYGVIRVQDYDELLEVAHLLAHTPKPAVPGLAVVSHSGGISSLTADMCGQAGLDLPVLGDAARDGINGILKGFGWAANPADVTGFANSESFPQIMEHMINDPRMGTLVVASAGADAQAQQVISQRDRTDKGVVFLWTGSRDAKSGLAQLKNARIPIFYTPDSLARGLQSRLAYHTWRERRLADGFATAPSRTAPQDEAIAQALGLGRPTLSESESKQLLAAWGVGSAREHRANSAEAAAAGRGAARVSGGSQGRLAGYPAQDGGRGGSAEPRRCGPSANRLCRDRGQCQGLCTTGSDHRRVGAGDGTRRRRSYRWRVARPATGPGAAVRQRRRDGRGLQRRSPAPLPHHALGSTGDDRRGQRRPPAPRLSRPASGGHRGARRHPGARIAPRHAPRRTIGRAGHQPADGAAVRPGSEGGRRARGVARRVQLMGCTPVLKARLDATGAVTRRRSDGSWERVEPRTDWARVDATTETEIERQAAMDDAEAAKDAAAWVRRVRRRAGLSQAEFAHRMGIAVATVRGWEQGRFVPQGAARALLRVIDRVPEAVLALSAS